MHRIDSIRGKLVAWILVPGLLLWGGASYWVYATANRYAGSTYDEILSTFLETLSYRVRLEDGRITFDFPMQLIPVLRERHVDTRYYQILGPNREVIAGDEQIPPPPAYPDRPTLYYGQYQGQPVRIASQKVTVMGTELSCYVQILETMTGRELAGRGALHSLAFGGLVLALLLTIVSLVAMRQILQPLNLLRQKLLKQSIEKMAPLSEQTAPVEVRPLVSAINYLLFQVSDDISKQKRFVRNAAHQLRTPLSGLKLQTELALREEGIKSLSPALNQIRRSIDQTNNLVDKLLSLATSEQAPDRNSLELCNLGQVVREALGQLAPLAVKRNIDLGLAHCSESPRILAEEWALRELAINIIENAIFYTPAGGSVTAKVGADGDFAFFDVVDTGSGIPAEERERIFEPFYRLPNSPLGGSGLGLAIVKELANRYDGIVIVDSPSEHRGTRVTVKFPISLTPQETNN